MRAAVAELMDRAEGRMRRAIAALPDGRANILTVGERRIATIGESMGAGSVLMTVGRDPSIGPVVTDSAYASAPKVVDEVGPLYSA